METPKLDNSLQIAALFAALETASRPVREVFICHLCGGEITAETVEYALLKGRSEPVPVHRACLALPEDNTHD